ncbi:aspartyl-phosphate phosphatase Spo0E family protein [Shouchella shacheensis]|uniref:aspartyl-phosphate phosphatase Spo0E family protein n=1 Tax=Shouchella shacheensis TaxID=1649580 RepID=UPI0007403282|nr:aspartyl-phosphate phosphatase Spo0E family protein [Shouchella shacheensis]
MSKAYQACKQKMERVREQMVQAASLHGLNHPLVQTYSEELDRLHNCLLAMEWEKDRLKQGT